MNELEFEINAGKSNVFQRFWREKRQKIVMDNVKNIGLKKGSSLLEVGCGIGSLSHELAELGYNVTSIDMNKDFINYAKKKYSHLKNLKFQLNDITKKTFPNKFNLIVSEEVIEHVKDQKSFLKNIRASIDENGYLILTTPNYSSLWYFLEKVWAKKATYDWSSTHYVKYNVKRFRKALQKYFQPVKIKTFFYISPFTPILSYKFSEFLFEKELDIFSERLKNGCIILGVFSPK